MQVSEARRAANQANSAHSTGPRTATGKCQSRKNSLTHGLTATVVLPESDQSEVESRVAALHDELQPQTVVGTMLIRKIANFSVRSERAAERENATIAVRVRHAVDAFDEERARRVETLCNSLHASPRDAVRNLRRMPEGCDRLIEAWRVLRRDLDFDGVNRWGSPQLAKAANLLGERHLDAHNLRIGDLSTAIWGEFYRLEAHEGEGLDNDGRRNWARLALLEIVDAQIAELEAHQATIDLDRIEQDRLDAPIISTFDDSKEACLARRYQADADRGFYKALKDFRQVEAEASVRIEPEPDLVIPDDPDPRMGSFRAPTPPSDRERALALLDGPMDEEALIRGADGLPLSITRPLPPPV